MDFFFRKMVKDQFAAVTALGQEIGQFAAGDEGGSTLAAERGLLGAAMQDVHLMTQALAGFAMASMSQPSEVYRAGLNTTRLLFAVGDVTVAWLLLRQAAVALRALDADPEGSDADFYRGKVASAKWFCAQVLPHLRAERQILEATTLDAMDLAEASF